MARFQRLLIAVFGLWRLRCRCPRVNSKYKKICTSIPLGCFLRVLGCFQANNNDRKKDLKSLKIKKLHEYNDVQEATLALAQLLGMQYERLSIGVLPTDKSNSASVRGTTVKEILKDYLASE